MWPDASGRLGVPVVYPVGHDSPGLIPLTGTSTPPLEITSDHWDQWDSMPVAVARHRGSIPKATSLRDAGRARGTSPGPGIAEGDGTPPLGGPVLSPRRPPTILTLRGNDHDHDHAHAMHCEEG